MRAVTTSPVAIAPTVTRRCHAARPAPRARAVARAFGSWKKKQEEEPEDDDDEAKINMRGLTQLIKMGLGTISGDITEINLYVTIRARETRSLPFGGVACCPGRWRVLTISSDDASFICFCDPYRDDPTRTVVMELEANNFEDADGKPLNFMNNDGIVGDKDEKTSPLNYVVPVVLGGVSVAGIVATLKALS